MALTFFTKNQPLAAAEFRSFGEEYMSALQQSKVMSQTNDEKQLIAYLAVGWLIEMVAPKFYQTMKTYLQ